MQGFRHFLLNEEKTYLGHRVGDVLTAVHDLEEDLPGMGSRHLQRVGEDIAHQIRRILHGQWSPRHSRDLKELQRIGVALVKAIEEKGDLKELVPQVAQALQTVAGRLGVKTNNLQAPEAGDETQGVSGDAMPAQETPPNGPPPGGLPGPGVQPALGGSPMQGLPGMPPG